MQWTDERVGALLLGRRAIRVVPIPGSLSEEGGEPLFVGVRVLKGTEADECRLDAAQQLKILAKQKDLEPAELLELEPDLLRNEERRAIVFRAFVEDGDAREPKRFFPSIQAVRQLRVDTFQGFWDLYVEHEDQVSPGRGLDEAAIKELADAIPKGLRQKAIWALCEPGSRLRWLHSLAAQPETSATGS